MLSPARLQGKLTAQKAANRVHAQLPGPGERANAQLKTWGDTPLHLAAAGLRYDAARALLAAGAPVNAVNRRGATALHYARDPRPLSPTWDPAAQRRVIDLLVSSGAAVDQQDRGGGTPLHRAVRAHRRERNRRSQRPPARRARNQALALTCDFQGWLEPLGGICLDGCPPAGEAPGHGAIVPLAELRRLRAVERYASPEAREEAEIEAILAAHDEWVAAGCPGARSHEDAMAELLGSDR